MDGKVIYIHYGAKRFDPSIGFPIRNVTLENSKNGLKYGVSTKPVGGFWASRFNASFGWKDWCEQEDFMDCDEDASIKFFLKEFANIKILRTIRDVCELPLLPTREGVIPTTSNIYCFQSLYIDFEKSLQLGIDAIELQYYGEEYKAFNKDNMHFTLYSWDCDSIVILNPYIVEQIS